MSTYDIKTDAPGLLRTEASNITLAFTRTGPTTGRVSWNIPSPAAGCAAGTQAYNGMVVTLDNTAATITKVPTNGTIYSADATANSNLFAGDRIASSFVVGAFYNDTTTTFFDITGLQANTPYYITGFPVDAQIRYYLQGVHAYSTEFANGGTPDTHGTQVVALNVDQQIMGVQPTDSTGLMAQLYAFKIQLGLVPAPLRPLASTECHLTTPTYDITVDGTVSWDFQHLVAEINKQLILINNNVQGSSPPNAGGYYWDATQQLLYLWDGFTSTLVQGVLVQNTAPTAVVTNTFWFNTDTGALQVYNVPNPGWNLVVYVRFGTDPTLPIANQTFWFNSTTNQGYLWDGSTWCESLTYYQSNDPSIPVPPAAGAYWYDSVTSILYKWNDTLGMWNVVDAVQYAHDPNTLTTTDYWFDTTTNLLYQYNTPSLGWNLQSNVAVTEIIPTTPAPGKYWYNPTAQTLQQFNGTIWITLSVISFDVDPTVRTSCGVWWNTSTNVLRVWDSINSVWVVVSSSLVYIQGADPTLAIEIADGTLWYDPLTGQLTVWSNSCFVSTTFISFPIDPRNMADGTAWFNTTTNMWYSRVLGAWVLITPTVSTQDPNSLILGTLWFDTTPLTGGLKQWNGISWVSIMYSTVPLAPPINSTWFNTATNTLMQWNGFAWIVGTPIATCELDCNGNMLFTDTNPGSLSYVNITDGSLFQSLAVKFDLADTIPGSDGVSTEASYNELGIGTDGSNDERLALHNEVRYELGYPTVDVEVTTQQMDYAIDKALSEFRSRSSLAYKSGFFFMSITPESQNYILSNKVSGMNKIVDVIGIYRLTSSFLSSAHGAGVYGQIVLQHLYNMGTFDLLSYHIMAEYTKLMEILFAARVTFSWNEQTRTVHLHNRFPFSERMVAIEASTERTEQQLLTDRYVKTWLRRYTLATVRLILAETRGKYANLPGAGGAITLNATDLRQAANAEIEACLLEIEQYVADKPEEYGKFDFTFG